MTIPADTARLARAATLQVRPMEQRKGEYEVTGGESRHVVTTGALYSGSAAWCDCPDFRAGRGTRACKHILAVAITLATDEERAEIASMLGIE